MNQWSLLLIDIVKSSFYYIDSMYTEDDIDEQSIKLNDILATFNNFW
jgi:hypothetical protein